MRSINAKLGLVAGLATFLSACGGSVSPNPFTEAPPAADEGNIGGSPDEIVRAEIERRGNNDHTAMALIRHLRPNWLLARGQNSFNDPSAAYPLVYIDEIRHGNLSTLNQIPATEVLMMQYFSTSDATTRWGTGHPSGVINVVTGR